MLIFGQEKDRILFQHSLHVDDEEIACNECHVGMENADGFSVESLPKEEFCLECHNDDDADGSCEYCHSNPDDPKPFKKSWVTSGLDFSHKKHLLDGEDCYSCHSYIADDDEIDVPHQWAMSDCQTCHNDLEKGPRSHDLLWKEFHGSEMNSSTSGNCALCHDNNSCEECHQLQEFEPEVHPSDYVLAHSFDAKIGIMECTTCHEIIEDCYSCHITNQIMPMNHNFHNWVSTEGGIHVDFAESEIELCATCHIPSEDATCLKCHVGD